MASDPITLVRWRDAKTDPPPNDEFSYLTHVKEENFDYAAVCTYLGSEDVYGDIVGYAWYYGDSGDPATPQPDLWADAPPPNDDPLTVADLMDALAALIEKHRGWVGPSAARLRRAIEKLEES